MTDWRHGWAAAALALVLLALAWVRFAALLHGAAGPPDAATVGNSATQGGAALVATAWATGWLPGWVEAEPSGKVSR